MSMIPNPGRRPRPNKHPTLALYPMELSRNLRVDSVSRLDPTPPRAIDANLPVSAAVTAMQRENLGCLLVTRGGRLVGLFTERDLLTRVLSAGLPLSTPMAECMTTDLVTVQPKDSVRAAVRKMQAGGYRHLPVVDDRNRPVGVLSARRVVHYIVEHFPALVYNQPPDPTRVPDSPHGA
jgi:CBS domain-containing protein